MGRPIVILLRVALLLLTFCILSHALSLSLGFRGGLNLSSLRSSQLDNEIAETSGDKDARVGLNIGGCIELSINNYFSFMSEFYYSLQGVKYTLAEEGVIVKIKESYDFIEIPIFGKVTIPLKSLVHPTFHAGIVPGVLTNAEVNEMEEGETVIEDVKKQTKDFNISFAFGVGIDYKIGPGKIISALRYANGLADIVKVGESRKTSVFTIFLGYVFNVGT